MQLTKPLVVFKKGAAPMKNLTPIKSIRAKCIDCSRGQLKEVKECPIKNCPLWPYRMGRRPKAGESINEDVLQEKTVS